MAHVFPLITCGSPSNNPCTINGNTLTSNGCRISIGIDNPQVFPSVINAIHALSIISQSSLLPPHPNAQLFSKYSHEYNYKESVQVCRSNPPERIEGLELKEQSTRLEKRLKGRGCGEATLWTKVTKHWPEFNTTAWLANGDLSLWAPFSDVAPRFAQKLTKQCKTEVQESSMCINNSNTLHKIKLYYKYAASTRPAWDAPKCLNSIQHIQN